MEQQPLVCAHGQLGRSCEICERDARIARMRQALVTTAGNIRSLGPAGALERVPEPYTIWLAVVEEAIRA